MHFEHTVAITEIGIDILTDRTINGGDAAGRWQR